MIHVDYFYRCTIFTALLTAGCARAGLEPRHQAHPCAQQDRPAHSREEAGADRCLCPHQPSSGAGIFKSTLPVP